MSGQFRGLPLRTDGARVDPSAVLDERLLQLAELEARGFGVRGPGLDRAGEFVPQLLVLGRGILEPLTGDMVRACCVLDDLRGGFPVCGDLA